MIRAWDKVGVAHFKNGNVLGGAWPNGRPKGTGTKGALKVDEMKAVLSLRIRSNWAVQSLINN